MKKIGFFDNEVLKLLEITSPYELKDIKKIYDHFNSLEKTIAVINHATEKAVALSEAIYFVENKSPVYNVLAVPIDKIRANSYNPNSVAHPEMKLLETSIWEDGYTMPVVCYYNISDDIYEIVDGFHRYTILKNSKRVFDREKGLLPVVVIDKDESNRVASTIRHNRARGSHDVELMSNIVSELTKAGMSDAWIIKHIGMDADEILRLKQISGLAELFKNNEFSNAKEV